MSASFFHLRKYLILLTLFVGLGLSQPCEASWLSEAIKQTTKAVKEFCNDVSKKFNHAMSDAWKGFEGSWKAGYSCFSNIGKCSLAKVDKLFTGLTSNLLVVLRPDQIILDAVQDTILRLLPKELQILSSIARADRLIADLLLDPSQLKNEWAELGRFALFEKHLSLQSPSQILVPSRTAPLFSLSQKLNDACRDETNSIECYAAQLAYHVKKIDLDYPQLEGAEMDKLEAKLLSKIMSPPQGKIPLEQIQIITDKMIEVDDRNPLAIQYGLSAIFSRWKQIKAKTRLSSQERSALLNLESKLAFYLAKHQENSLHPLREVEFEINIARLNGDLTAMNGILDGLEEDASMGGLKKYYEAWSLDLKGQREKSLAKLREISEVEAFYQSAQLILKAPKSPRSGLPFFEGVSSFSFQMMK